MKKIFIDLTDIREWNGNYGGIQRVVYGIAKNFNNNKPDIYKVVFVNFVNDEYFTAVKFELDNNEDKLNINARKYSLANIQTRFLSKKNIDKPISIQEGDVFLVLGKPWDNPKIQSYLKNIKDETSFYLVQVVYDLVICLYPHLQNPVLYDVYRNHMISVMKTSDLLLSISESTKNDIKKFCREIKIEPPKICTIRLGDEVGSENDDFNKPSSKIKKDFIACIGTVEIRKNHTLLYYVYKLAAQKGIKLPQLIIVGSSGWLSGDIQYLINSDKLLKDNIIMLNNVDDNGLRWIYDNCKFTIYPSIYEGWGLPVAESLTRGKYCISSSASSMPEIAGDLIDYFNPYDQYDCLEKIILYSKQDLSSRELRIKSNYRVTKWFDTYNQVLSEIRKITDV